MDKNKVCEFSRKASTHTSIIVDIFWWLPDVLIYLKLVIFSHVNQILQNAKFDAFFTPKKSAILIKNVREQCSHTRDFFHVCWWNTMLRMSSLVESPDGTPCWGWVPWWSHLGRHHAESEFPGGVTLWDTMLRLSSLVESPGGTPSWGWVPWRSHLMGQHGNIWVWLLV